jgi:hypothetical protein
VLKKKNWANLGQRIIELFTQKIVTKLSKIWIWDPGSGKNLFLIPDPGVKKAPDPGSRGQKGTGSRIPDPGSGSATLHALLVLYTRVRPFRLNFFSLISEIKQNWIHFACVSLVHLKNSILIFRFFSLFFASNFSLRFN